MTEDEAFIRTIVDRPGDDLPRLVYADWLDERDDLRGLYLREELTWVKAGRPDAGYEKSVLSWVSTSLDPVWVARVSRPPVGVCIDPNYFQPRRERVSEENISALETAIGLPITGEYKAFLLNVNGGVPRNAYRPADDPRFFSCDPKHTLADRFNLEVKAARFRSDLPRTLTFEIYEREGDDSVPEWRLDAIPIGNHQEYFTLFYAVRGEYSGRLHLQEDTDHWRAFGAIAGAHGPPTLSEYLHRLVDHDSGLTEAYPSQPLQEFWRR